MARGDHALDRHRSLGDEQLVAFDPPPGGGVLELAVVGEPGIVGVVDPHAVTPPVCVGRVDASTDPREHRTCVLASVVVRHAAPEFDADFGEPCSATHLDATSWVDHCPGWLRGADQLLDELVADAAASAAHRRAHVRPDRRRAAAVGLVADQHGAARAAADPARDAARAGRALRRAVRLDRLQPVPRRQRLGRLALPTATPTSSPTRSSPSSASARRARSGCGPKGGGARCRGSSATATCS